MRSFKFVFFEISRSKTQEQGAQLLFERYHDLENAYTHVIKVRNIFINTDRNKAEGQFKDWLIETKSMQIKEFNTVANIIQNKLNTILNYFDHRHKNSNTESFNAKIKLFRTNLRGVIDPAFFLFRLEKLFV
jgi:transposase